MKKELFWKNFGFEDKEVKLGVEVVYYVIFLERVVFFVLREKVDLVGS